MVATGSLGDGEAAGPEQSRPRGSSGSSCTLYSGRGAGWAGGRVGISLEAAGLLIQRTLPQLLAGFWGGWGGRGRWGLGQV